MHEREWQAYHDVDLSQWQVHDGARVLATGIEDENEAILMASARDVLMALKAAREVILAVSERDGNMDHWNEGGEGYAVYGQVVKAINKAEGY